MFVSNRRSLVKCVGIGNDVKATFVSEDLEGTADLKCDRSHPTPLLVVSQEQNLRCKPHSLLGTLVVLNTPVRLSFADLTIQLN